MDDIIKAKRYAVNLLSRKMYTESEMLDRLQRKGFDKEVSDSVVLELMELGYIDDFEYARLYFADNVNINSKGVYRISMELLRKGISKDIIESVSSEIEDDVYSKLKEYVYLKIQRKMPSDFKEEEKLKAHLLRRGYSISDVNRVLNEIKEEMQTED